MSSLANPKSAILTFPTYKVIDTLIINKYILWFHISMKHSSTMAIGYPINNLSNDTFDFLLRQFFLFGLQIFLKVIVIVVKDDF